MNMNEWKQPIRFDGKFYYYNKTRKIQRSLQYNSDPNAIVRHHLRDTEEQRKYNDEHYEMWGFEIDENGNEHFEYGKYIIFVTKEEHSKIHACSEETRNKRSKSLSGENHPFYGRHHTEEAKKKISNAHLGVKNHNYGKPRSEDTRKKISESNKRSMTDERRKLISSYRSGSKVSSETIEKMRLASIGRKHSNNTKHKMSASHIGHFVSDETRRKISTSNKLNYESNEQRKISLSEKLIGRTLSEEHKKHLSEHHADFSGENHPFYGRHHTEETKKKICESCKAAWTDDKRHNQSIKMSSIAKINQSKRSILYSEYKTKGGSMKWNQFQSNLQSLIIEYNLGDNIND